MTANINNVLQVSNNHFIAGGSDRYYFELSDALRASGVAVSNFAARDVRNLPSDCSDFFPKAPAIEQARASDFPRYVFSRAAQAALRRLLATRRIDLAHLHIYYGRLTASILKPLREAGVPIIQTLHEYKLICAAYTCERNGMSCEECGGRRFWKAVQHRCKQGSLARSAAASAESYISKRLGSHDLIDHFITVSDFQRARLLANDVCDADRVTTIHNFVDPERLVPQTDPGSYVLYFGRIERLKGIDTLLDAMAELPAVNLRIVGDGGYRQGCAERIRMLGLKNVEMLEFQEGEELLQTIRNATCTVLPAEWYENCPMSVLESLALGKPVIGTDIGGIPELIDDGVDGLVVPVSNAGALSEAIGSLAENSAMTRQMGEAAREKIESRFSPAAHLQSVRQIYEQVKQR